jgi:tRNA threonylcarbamoyl adenosine modification protein YeaZ
MTGLVLAFDTSAAHCAAALLSGDRVVASRAEPMTRGQAERLMPLCAAMLDEAGVAWSELDRIGVGVGPGNFTGIRIAVSAARGLALGLGIPAIGVSTFDAILEARETRTTTGPAAVPGPRGAFYLQAPGARPELAPDAPPHAALPPEPEALAARIARIAAGRDPGARPAPLYIRPADAAPARDLPPVILDDA